MVADFYPWNLSDRDNGAMITMGGCLFLVVSASMYPVRKTSPQESETKKCGRLHTALNLRGFKFVMCGIPYSL